MHQRETKQTYTITPFPHAWTILRLTLAVTLFAVVAVNVRVQDLLTVWQNLVWPWLGGAILAFWTACFLMGLRAWQLFNRRVPAPALIELTVIQTVTGNLIASSAGLASYVALLIGRYGITLRQTVWTVLLARFADALVLLGCLTFTSVALWSAIEPVQGLVTLLISGLTIGTFGIILLFSQRQRLLTIPRRLMNVNRLGRPSFFDTIVARLTDALQLTSRYRGSDVTALLAYSGAIMLAQFAFGYCSLRMFGVALDPRVVLFVITLNLIVTMVPIQILGGLGIVELTSLYLYGLFGINEASLAPVLISGRVVFYLINLVTLLYLPIGTWTGMTGEQQQVTQLETPFDRTQQ